MKLRTYFKGGHVSFCNSAALMKLCILNGYYFIRDTQTWCNMGCHYYCACLKWLNVMEQDEGEHGMFVMSGAFVLSSAIRVGGFYLGFLNSPSRRTLFKMY